jgi:hypothetical protein
VAVNPDLTNVKEGYVTVIEREIGWGIGVN